MDKEKGKSESKTSLRLDSSSRFWKTFLTVLAASLTFAGPTYAVLALINVLKIDHVLSMVSGAILLIAGLVLIAYLIKHKVIS